MASLELLRHKLTWAERHRHTLLTEMDRFFNESVPHMLVEMTPGVVMDYMTVWGPPVPLEIPLIIGDCLQNLRSSLDYLVWDLCVASNIQPTDRTKFPICDDKKYFDKAMKNALQGVPVAAQSEIENLQPFQAPMPKLHDLWMLNKLSNITKHRNILVTALQAVRTERRTGAVIDRRSVDHPFKGEMELDYDPVVGIYFEEAEVAHNEEVSGLLRRLSDYISIAVLPNLERFLA